jgi:hypothetical protein
MIAEPSPERLDTPDAARPAASGDPDRLTPTWWPFAVLLGAGLLLTLAGIGPPALAGVLWLTLAWFTVPGIVLAWWLYATPIDDVAKPGGESAPVPAQSGNSPRPAPNQPGERSGAASFLPGLSAGAWAALLVGPLWGFALSSLMLLVLWAAGLRHWSLLVITPPLAWLACLAFWRLRGALTPPNLSLRDVPAVLLLLCVVPLVVGRPYARVGEAVADGRAYRAYFTADFVWAMAVVAEVSKGDVPPHNQFLRDQPLNYYWTPHLLSAVEYRHLSTRATLEAVMLVNALAFGLIFVAFLYAFTRHFTRSPALAAVGCFAAILLTSFEGLDRLFVIWRDGLPLAHLTSLNIDSVTRWFYGALPVDGLHRLLLYQPQHHAMAYALGFSTLMVLAQARNPARPLLMALVGVLLAASVMISAFAALMLTVMAALYAAILIGRRRAWRAFLLCALAAAIPLAAAAAASLLLRYVTRSESILELIVNEGAIARPWIALPLSFGPMLATVAAGLTLAALRRDAALLPLGIVVGVSAFFFVFVNVRDHQDVYVGFRAGHFFFMAAAPLTAVVIGVLWRGSPAVRRTAAAAGISLALAAAPTVAIDLYNTQDITNREMGPGFRWTLVLSHDELAALAWIRRETPTDAIVQVNPLVRDPETWSYIPTFAERRMAVGLPISMVPLEPYRVASRRMRLLYGAETAQDAFDVAWRNSIHFLVVGPPERTAYPTVERMLDAAPLLFPLVFRNDAVSIYQAVPLTSGAR